MKRFLALLLLTAACGEGSASRELTPAAAQPTAPSLYARACAARHQPETTPTTPRQHSRALGTVEFGSGEQAVRQSAELWLAGPTRMRYVISNGSVNKNVFLLEAAGMGWLSAEVTGRPAAKWEAYSDPAIERETLLRWELARFPWGWSEVLAEAGSETRTFVMRAAEGEVVIELDEALLPTSASYAGVDAQLADWAAATDSGRLHPRVWSWSGPSGRRTEQFDTWADGWIFFDEWFRPPASESSSDLTLRTTGKVESIGVVEAQFWRLPGGSQAAPGPDCFWWRSGEERFAGALLPSGSPPPLSTRGEPAKAEAASHWLRWIFVGSAEQAARAVEELRETARATGLIATGAAILLDEGRPDGGQTILLPIAPPPPR